MAVGRFSVPLNTMCSRKWASPFVRTSSAREPAPTNTFTLTDCAVGTGVVTTRRPPSSSLISQVIDIGPPSSGIGSRPVYRLAAGESKGAAGPGLAADEPNPRLAGRAIVGEPHVVHGG